MSAPRTPYDDTSVPVSRSQVQVLDMLKDAGAKGVQLEQMWDADNVGRIRFLWRVRGTLQTVRLTVARLPEELHGTIKTPEQRERQAWRGLYWYLKTTLEAATFGFLTFEDLFMSYFEGDDGRTIGEYAIGMLEQGRLALPRGDAE
jgi:hypothetical protein